MRQQGDLFAPDFAAVQAACLNSPLFLENARLTGRAARRMQRNPYENTPTSGWRAVTQTLVDSHPLKPRDLLRAVSVAWEMLWCTTFTTQSGISKKLHEIDLSASALGSLFEKLLALELSTAFPDEWRAGQGSEKDLSCLLDGRFSIELKTSGQLGYKVFGNRSFNQSTGERAKKDKSGYYLTVNFYGQKLTLIRFGWLDAGDWQGQKASSGQAATLSEDVYLNKLVTVPGRYILDGPVQLVEGAGERLAAELASIDIWSIRDLIEAKGLPHAYRKLQYAAMRHSDRRELRIWQ